MKEFKLILLLILGVIVVLLVVQNTAPVETRFLWLRVYVPAIIVLFVTAVAGFGAGILVALSIKDAKKSKT